jgi:hypothetical protein
MLLAHSYQLVISGAHLAEMPDFRLLRSIQALEPFVPFVVTADASEKESARRVLGRGPLISSLLHQTMSREGRGPVPSSLGRVSTRHERDGRILLQSPCGHRQEHLLH